MGRSYIQHNLYNITFQPGGSNNLLDYHPNRFDDLFVFSSVFLNKFMYGIKIKRVLFRSHDFYFNIHVLYLMFHTVQYVQNQLYGTPMFVGTFFRCWYCCVRIRYSEVTHQLMLDRYAIGGLTSVWRWSCNSKKHALGKHTT